MVKSFLIFYFKPRRLHPSFIFYLKSCISIDFDNFKNKYKNFFPIIFSSRRGDSRSKLIKSKCEPSTLFSYDTSVHYYFYLQLMPSLINLCFIPLVSLFGFTTTFKTTLNVSPTFSYSFIKHKIAASLVAWSKPKLIQQSFRKKIHSYLQYWNCNQQMLIYRCWRMFAIFSTSVTPLFNIKQNLISTSLWQDLIEYETWYHSVH